MDLPQNCSDDTLLLWSIISFRCLLSLTYFSPEYLERFHLLHPKPTSCYTSSPPALSQLLRRTIDSYWILTSRPTRKPVEESQSRIVVSTWGRKLRDAPRFTFFIRDMHSALICLIRGCKRIALQHGDINVGSKTSICISFSFSPSEIRTPLSFVY